jgi:hypothetical protein
VRSNAYPQAAAATIAIVVLLLFFAYSVERSRSLEARIANRQSTAEIGVEHDEPVSLSITASAGKGQSLVEVSHDGSGVIFVSLPELWELREVRRVSLENVSHEVPTFGFTRWHIPAAAVLSFVAPTEPAVLTIHNASKARLAIRFARVNLATGTVQRNVVLTQEGTTQLR